MEIGYQVHRLAHAVAACAEKAMPWLLAALSIFYLITTCVLANHKQLWYDELFTYQMSQLPSVSDIIRELANGADPLPPLYYLLTRAAVALFGHSEAAIRLPAILGFWVMALCLYRFARRWCPPLYALAAMLFPLATAAYHTYAMETKPYGFLLGCCGVALVCWQSATRGEGRPWSVLGLWASLAAAVVAHYYAVVLLVPLALGELSRTVSRRRLDLPVAVAICGSLVPLAFLVPLIEAARSYAHGYEGAPGWDGIFRFYKMLLEMDLLPLIGILGGLMLFPWLTGRRGAEPAEPAPPLPPLHELAAVTALALLPVFVVLLAKTATGGYYDRYALGAVVGCAVGAVFVACRHGRGCPVVGVLMVLTLGGWVTAKQVYLLRESQRKEEQQQALFRSLQRDGDPRLPIAVGHPALFLQLAQYAPPDLAPRLVYLDSQELSLRYWGHSTMDRALNGMKPLSTWNVQNYRSFVQAHPRFQVHGTGGWLLPALLDEGAEIRLKAPGLFLVER